MGKTKGGEAEEDWEPRYGNDSRPWLLGFSEREPTASGSTTKDTFTALQALDTPTNEGVRKKQLKRALWLQAQTDVARELDLEEEVPPVNTHYNEHFVKDGFTPRPIKTDPELHRQYPLYGDEAVSLWSERFPDLPGATRATRSHQRFHRYTGFTTPIDLSFDNSLDSK